MQSQHQELFCSLSFQVLDTESKAAFLDVIIIITGVKPEGPEVINRRADKLEKAPVWWDTYTRYMLIAYFVQCG